MQIVSTKTGRGEAERWQRVVIELMLQNAEGARAGLAHLDRECFLDPLYVACFEAFKDVPLPERPEEPIDIVLWVRAAQRVLRQWDQSARISDIINHLRVERPQQISLDAAVEHMRQEVFAVRLVSAGEQLTRRALEPGVDPYELAIHTSGHLRDLSRRRGLSRWGTFGSGGTLADLVSRNPQPPPWLIRDVLRQGSLAFLVGQSRLGKTWLALEIARCVASGRPFFGHSSEATPVCAVLLESPDWAVLERLDATGHGEWLSSVHQETPSSLGRSTIDVRMSHERHELIAWVNEVQAGLLILDPFTYFHSHNENDAQEMKQVLSALDEIRLETGAALLILHHERKGKADVRPGSDELDVMRGSSALAGAADVVLRLAMERGLTKLRFSKVREGRTPAPTWLRQTEAGPFEIVDPPEDFHHGKLERIEATREVLRVADDWLSVSEIIRRLEAQGSSMKPNTVRSQYLPQLVNQGKVEMRRKSRSNEYRWKPGVHCDVRNGLVPFTPSVQGDE